MVDEIRSGNGAKRPSDEDVRAEHERNDPNPALPADGAGEAYDGQVPDSELDENFEDIEVVS